MAGQGSGDVAAGPEGSMYNYVVTAQRPSAVTKSVVGHFTSPIDVNLIISKCTRIEIHTLTKEGLQGVVDVPIYGRISTMELYRPQSEDKDLLFISTEQYKFCVLSYDSDTSKLVTRASGDLRDRVGRLCNNGQIGIIDPKCRLIGLHLYDGILKVIPMDERGQLQEAFNVRLEELSVVDLAFLEGCSRPTLAVLYEDNKEARHVKTYELVIKDKDLVDGPWQQHNLDAGASMLIPVPAPFGGCVVVGESVVAYLSEKQPMKCTAINQTVVQAYGRVDEDGSRYLLGDYLGNLHLLVLAHDSQQVVGLKLNPLGRTATPSTLSYLDNGVVFVGSCSGDSQLVKLHAQPPSPQEPDNYLEVLECITNLAPIVDFCVVDLDRGGQGQVVTCSGVGHDGSLRIVRNGIGVIEQASIELPGIRGVWSLRDNGLADAHARYLVLAFVSETRVLAINDNDELDEAQLPGFDEGSQTLWCGNVVGGQIVQVTPAAVRLLDGGSKQCVATWQPPNAAPINIAAASPSQLLLAVGGGQIVYLQVQAGALAVAGQRTLQQEVACIDISPIEGEGAEASSLAAVGGWDMSLTVFRMDASLTQLTAEALGGTVIPRSCLLARIEGTPYLLCGLGDGHLLNFRVDAATGALSERKVVSLGTKPITLATFTTGGAAHVFAASDRPTIIYGSGGKLLYSNLNEAEVNFMTSFDSASFPDCLAIAKEGGLTIGGIDEIQKLHIRTVPLGEQPRRIAHDPSTRSFAVLTTAAQYGGTGADEVGSEYVRLIDDSTFETVDRETLSSYEMACSLGAMRFEGDDVSYYVVGTALALPDEEEPKKGRLLVFSSAGGKLTLVTEKETRGAVFSVNAFEGKLLACINSRVQLYRWTARDDGTRELVNECGHSGHIMALFADTCGDFVVVGDLMKSMQLLQYKAEEGALQLRASDLHSHWMTAVAALDADCYLGAENSYNLFTLRRNSEAANDEERDRLERVGEFHLGEMVNRFRRGSLVMAMPDSEAARFPQLLAAGVNGVISVVTSLLRDQFVKLDKLQACLRKVVRGVGGLDHLEWRTFSNERGVGKCFGFVDGDLVEQYLDLSRAAQEQVAVEMGEGATADALYAMVEELSRLH